MEVYILDDLFRRVQVVDKFESLIWSERMRSAGDFELTLHASSESRSMFPLEQKLSMSESHRVMIVKTLEYKFNADGQAVFSVKGSSLESILEDRIARNTLSSLTTTPKWVLTGKPTQIARQIFNEVCVMGKLDPKDVIPFVSTNNIFPNDTIAEPPTSITWEIEPKTVYEALTEICEIYDFGFRLIRNADTSQLYFNVYMGSDRTTSQSTLPPVVFAPDLDNLQDTSELTTSATYKNVAYVFSPVGSAVVYPDVVDADVDGFERHVLLVQADDITSTTPSVALAQMIQRGKEELSKNRRLTAFDGEINQSSSYKYNVHYNLGDLVEIRNVDGATNNMQVTEQIFVSDKEGDRSYPTLSLNQFILPGTWLAWDYNQVWQDVGPTEYWANA